jgi:hypothetical protein
MSATLKNSCRALFSTLSLAAIAFLVLGCGSNSTPTSISSQTQTAPAFIVGTDAPLPSVVSFAVQIQSIDAITSSGTSVPLLSGTPTVDFARFNGLQTLLDMNDVPVGTYTGVTVTLGSATIGYLSTTPPSSGVSGAPSIQTEPATLTTSTITQTLAHPLTVSTSGPVGLHLDFDLHKSIAVDSNNQITGTVTPTFNINVVDRNDSGAYIDEFDAAVLTVNPSAQTFTIQGPHGRQFTVNVNGQTMWDNNEGLSNLSPSSIVQLSGLLDRADSTLDADEVAIVSQDGFFAAGLMTYVAPTSGPATSFDLYTRATLPADTGITLGSISQVDLTGSENFFIHRMHGAVSQFLFNSSSLLPGQRIAVGGPATGASNPQAVTVKRISLRQEGYTGTIVAGSVDTAANTFQMQVDGFAGLLIPQTVTVYVREDSTFRSGLNSLNNLQAGVTIRAVGILLKDPATGTPVLLAHYVDALN